MQRLNIHRSDTGDVVMNGPLMVSGLNGNVAASITAAELIINHPQQIGNDQTTAPRPAGECNIVDDNPQFGEAVLGATNAALATVTRTVTIRNDGNDCLSIDAIADNAPYAKDAATAAALPVVLDPGEEFDATIVFAPAATGNNIDRTLAVTTTPANGDNQIDCEGSARMAEAEISTSTNTLAFGMLVHPSAATQTFTVTNTGELDVTITIAGPPAGSDFAWAPIAAPGLALAVGATTPARMVTYSTSGDGPATPRAITVIPSAGANSDDQLHRLCLHSERRDRGSGRRADRLRDDRARFPHRPLHRDHEQRRRRSDVHRADRARSSTRTSRQLRPCPARERHHRCTGTAPVHGAADRALRPARPARIPSQSP